MESWSSVSARDATSTNNCGDGTLNVKFCATKTCLVGSGGALEMCLCILEEDMRNRCARKSKGGDKKKDEFAKSQPTKLSIEPSEQKEHIK